MEGRGWELGGNSEDPFHSFTKQLLIHKWSTAYVDRLDRASHEALMAGPILGLIRYLPDREIMCYTRSNFSR